MRFFPSPPVVSAAVAGFVIGVLVTLVLNGAFATTSKTATPTATPVPPSVTLDEAQVISQLNRIASRELGPSPNDVNRSRLLSLWISAPHGYPSAGVPVTPGDTVHIRFELYDNPLGRAWRLRSAKADVFTLLKTLYTSGLPVYNVVLSGTFFPRPGQSGVIQRALEAYIPESVAQRIPWKKWGREHEGFVWNQLPYKYVNSLFA